MNKDPYDIFVFYQENQADTYWCYRYEFGLPDLETYIYYIYYKNSKDVILHEEYNMIINGVLYKHITVEY